MTYVTVQAHHKLSNVIARLCSTTAQLSMCYSKQQNSSTWQAAWCLIVLSIRAQCDTDLHELACSYVMRMW